MKRSTTTLYCDFCHLSEHAVSLLVAGPDDVCICNACIARASDAAFGTIRIALDAQQNVVNVTRCERKESGDFVRKVIWQRASALGDEFHTFVFEGVPGSIERAKAGA